jgi:trans-aconitate 2-methyltransferase
MAYLFKDTDLAARRLQVLAEVFAPASRAFLLDMTREKPELALDLGCGPGYTTRLLAETTQCARAIGLDASEYFVALAVGKATEQIAFLRHDLTQTPFPTDPGDLLFCRMLLTHLQNPLAIIERWATQMRPGGLLLLDEVEWIRTEHTLFRTYLSIIDAMLGQQANQLYIGPLLDSQQPGGELKRRLSRVYHLPVSTRQAATMFSLNIPAWKRQPFIQERYQAGEIEQLEAELRELAACATGKDEIEWGMRQVAYERV